MDLVAELANVSRALDHASVPYAVCGGIAVTIHGHVRATKDIDLLIQPHDRDSAVSVVRGLGYDVPAVPMTFGAGTPAERHVQRVTKLDAGEVMTIEFLLVGPAYETVWAERESYAWEGTTLTVVSRDGLVAMKRIAGRTQDLADIERLTGGDGDE